MKSKLMKLLLVSFVLTIFFSHTLLAQGAPRFTKQEILDSTAVLTAQQQESLRYYSTQYFKWEIPVLDKIDLDSLKQQKSDNEIYLANIENFERTLKKNQTELSGFYKHAQEQAKVVKNERKNSKEKRKFYLQDEKMLKTEKKLRDKELKLILNGKKALKKEAKNLESWQVDEKNRKYEERESQVRAAEERWNQKREINQQNLSQISEELKEYDNRDADIRERINSLNVLKKELDLKAKQIALEKKQTKNEIKLAKALIKQQKK